MKRLVHLFIGLLLTACAGNTSAQQHPEPLETVAHVDLGRYVGTWYEIASFPQSFQRNCTGTTATYELRADGQIDVINRCRKHTLDGRAVKAKGRARVVDPVTNAKLEVSFFRPFWGDYWIIDLGPDYEYAVVGHPTREYLWILARDPSLAPEVYDAIIERLAAQGYDTSRLVPTLQPTQAAASAE
jgi:apolipoprotein D and lipocalin family protein